MLHQDYNFKKSKNLEQFNSVVSIYVNPVLSSITAFPRLTVQLQHIATAQVV
jgi:hypothetical protein